MLRPFDVAYGTFDHIYNELLQKHVKSVNKLMHNWYKNDEI